MPLYPRPLAPGLLLLSLAMACAGGKDDEGGCDSFAQSSSVAGRTLSNGDDCGLWELAVDAHIYINVYVVEPDRECEAETTGGVTIPYDPIYSHSANDEPKWTFDVLGVEPGEGMITVSCDEGTTWAAKFEVVE